MKKYLIAFVAIAAIAFFFSKKGKEAQGDYSSEAPQAEVSVKKSEKLAGTANPAKSDAKDNFDASAYQAEISMGDSFYANNKYFNSVKNDDAFAMSFRKSKSVLKDAPNSEDIALWIALGAVMDSSPEYGELLSYAMNRINENASRNFSSLEALVKELGPDDAFARGQIINLVNQMSIASEDKIRFFGNEISRQASIDSEGKFSEDSLNVTTALIMLKNNDASNDDVAGYMKESLRTNQNSAVREKLMVRFRTYYPLAARSL